MRPDYIDQYGQVNKTFVFRIQIQMYANTITKSFSCSEKIEAIEKDDTFNSLLKNIHICPDIQSSDLGSAVESISYQNKQALLVSTIMLGNS